MSKTLRKMKTLSAIVIGAALIAFTTNEPIPRHNVFFPWNSTELNGSAARVVESVYLKTAAGDQVRFGIKGPISNVHGTAEKNRINSGRANSIVNLLQRISPDEDTFEIVDVSDPYRPKPFDMAAGKPFDLEVLVTKAQGWIEPDFTLISDYLPIPVQQFTIDPREENRLVGQQGTVINIPANALALRDGKVPSEMKVELKEVYGSGQILNADLHTNSGGRMLETGGTIHLKASTDGSPAHISSEEKIDLEFPIGDTFKEEDMQVFNGRVDRSGAFDWIEPGSGIIRERHTKETFYINDELVSKEEYYRTMQEWKDRKAEYEQEKKEREQLNRNYDEANRNSNALNAYLLSTDELGWINCDRFYDVEEKTEVIVMVDTAMRPSVKMVFDNISSVMNGTYSPKQGTVVFRGIPVGESVRIVGYSIKDGVPHMANRSTTISTDLKMDLLLAATTKRQLEIELASLN